MVQRIALQETSECLRRGSVASFIVLFIFLIEKFAYKGSLMWRLSQLKSNLALIGQENLG